MPSIINSDDGVSSGTSGLKTTGGNDGITVFQQNGAEAARISANGNVGIGTTNTNNFRLAVVGGRIQLGSGTTSQEGIAIQRASGYASITGINNDNNAFNPIAFFTSGTEAARIDSSGNMFVGRTSNLGTSRFVVEADTTSTNPMTVSNSRSTAATDYSVLFYRNATLVGSIQTTLSATSYVTSSDYRLKENVQPMTGALAKVVALKPCTYTWKSDGTSGQGFIAHELAEVVPDAVTGEKDAVNEDGSIKPQGIDASFLVATLTAAIQELKAELDATKAEVAALKGAA